MLFNRSEIPYLAIYNRIRNHFNDISLSTLARIDVCTRYFSQDSIFQANIRNLFNQSKPYFIDCVVGVPLQSHLA